MEKKRAHVTCYCLLGGWLVMMGGVAWAKNDGHALEHLRRDYLGADDVAARIAATQLGQLKSDAAMNVLLDGLALGLVPSVAEAALVAVTLFPKPMAVDVLRHYAQHRRPALRVQAVRTLGMMEEKRAVAAWRMALHDNDAKVRQEAVNIVVKRKDRTCIDALVALLKRGDPFVVPGLAAMVNADVAIQIAGLVGQVPDALLTDCLARLLRRGDLGKEEAYVALVRALGQMPTADSTAALDHFLKATKRALFAEAQRAAKEIADNRKESNL